MSSFKKVLVVPEEKLTALQECASFKRDSIERILKVTLYLANNKGYNEKFEIRNENGVYIGDSNVVSLITKLENEDIPLLGENDFLNLLREAKIPLDLIRNEYWKSKLISINEAREITGKADDQRASPGRNEIVLVSGEAPIVTVTKVRYHDVYSKETKKRSSGNVSKSTHRRKKTSENLIWKRI